VNFAVKKTVYIINDSRVGKSRQFVSSAKHERQVSAVLWSNSCWY